MVKSESYNTKQKELLLEVIKNYGKEFTIKDIYNKLNGSVGLTTIYRFVDKLVLDKKISKYIDNENNTIYQYLDECDHDNHFYLKCEKCKNLFHIDCDCINELSNHIYKKHNFRTNNNNLIINGICNKCSGGKNN